jgi:LysR family hydrogen peroxide-inducible transcriptional activator
MPSVHDLSIRQLEYIVAVADTLGFHKAAERCGVSQPTLSAQVREAEEVLGVALFERDTRRVLVTPPGAQVLERARRVLRELEDLLETAARTKDPFAGAFRFGVIPTVAPYLLPDVSLAWSKAYPKLQIAWREEQTDPLLAKVDRGEVDAALVSLLPGMEGLAVEPVLEDPFLVALPKGHPLAKQTRVKLADLEGLTVLLLDDGHCLRTETLALCGRAGTREAGFRATSLSTLAQMVSSGAGITLLPRLAVAVENRRGQLELRPFAEKKPPSRTIVMAFRPSSPFGETFRTLAKTLRAALGSA